MTVRQDFLQSARSRRHPSLPGWGGIEATWLWKRKDSDRQWTCVCVFSGGIRIKLLQTASIVKINN